MCGIAGILDWQQPNNHKLASTMISALQHRGPNNQQTKKLGPLTLGHARLAIIDTRKNAHQPMADSSGRFWISFNGEIYNFKQVKDKLQKYNISFKTNSDTEVILAAWRHWGPDCVLHLAGMFAFALWDSYAKELFLVRDRLGEKPLFYSFIKNKNILVFASELNALKLHPDVSEELNLSAVNQFLSLNYIMTNSCILKNINKLPPAHILKISENCRPSVTEYWKLNTFFNQPNPWKCKKDAEQKLNSLLMDSVSQQTISDVPLGAFLSGGIDSSSIVSNMCHAENIEKIQTFSIGFKEKSYNELDKSQQVSKYLNVEYYSKIVDFNLTNLLPEIVSSIGEPFADTSMIPTYLLSKFTRDYVTVSLSGDGGDELFAGYETYLADKFHSYFNLLPPKFIEILSYFAKYWPTSFNKVSFDYKLKKFLDGCMLPFQKAHYSWRTIFSEHEKKQILKKDVYNAVEFSNPFLHFENFFNDVKKNHPINQAMYVDLKTWLVDDILVKVDRCSMAHSLEVRAPFLDHRLVEFAASLPISWKLQGLQKKHILKNILTNKLPRNIVHAKKEGFNSPISIWFSNDLCGFARDVSTDPSLNHLFNIPYIQELWKEHITKRKDHGLKLFGLTCFGLWLHQHSKQSNNLNGGVYDFYCHSNL